MPSTRESFTESERVMREKLSMFYSTLPKGMEKKKIKIRTKKKGDNVGIVPKCDFLTLQFCRWYLQSSHWLLSFGNHAVGLATSLR